jgi:hypothetical protein
MWLRMTLSNSAAPGSSEDGSGPQGGYAHGETEDYLLPGRALQPTRTPTLAPTRTHTPQPTYTSGPSPTVTKTSTPSACLGVPTLISPTNGSRLDTLIPVFSIDVGAHPNAIGYDIQISRNAFFSSIYLWVTSYVMRPGVNSHDPDSNFDPSTKYYWRARFKCGQTQAAWSATWSFTTGSGGNLPPAPALTAPISGTLLTSWPVMLYWSAVPGTVMGYSARWCKPGTPYECQEKFSTTTQVQAWGLEANTLYQWSVEARNYYGIGPRSVWWRFTTPSTPPPDDLMPSPLRLVNEDGSAYWLPGDP